MFSDNSSGKGSKTLRNKSAYLKAKKKMKFNKHLIKFVASSKRI